MSCAWSAPGSKVALLTLRRPGSPLLAGALPRSEVAVAVVGVTFQLNSLIWMPANALGMAASTHVGNALGAGEAQRAQRAVHAGLALGLALMAAAALGVRLAGPRLFGVFTSDAQVVEASKVVVSPLALSVIGG